MKTKACLNAAVCGVFGFSLLFFAGCAAETGQLPRESHTTGVQPSAPAMKPQLLAQPAALAKMPAPSAFSSSPNVTVVPNLDVKSRQSHYVVMSGHNLVLKEPQIPYDHSRNLHWQWRRNDQDLPGETNKHLSITNVTHAHAGTYTVVFTNALETESEPLYLSVVSYFTNQSNGGQLSLPLGLFTTSTSGYTVCGTPGFNKYRVEYPFPSSLYPNTSGETNLVVDTCTNINGATVDTGIRICRNYDQGQEMVCNDNFNCGVGNNNLSSCVLTGLVAGRSYRVGIYYKSNTLGTATNITFRWKYTDGFTF